MTLRNRRLVRLICLVTWAATSGTRLIAQSGPPPLDSQALLYRSALAVAEKSLRLNETEDAQRWLEAAPVNLRGWEWDYLHSLSDECFASVAGAPDSLTALDVSPDGSMLAVADAAGSVALLKIPSMERIRSIGDHSQAVYSVAFSNDGHRLATVSRDVTARVWDIESGQQVSQIKLDNPGVAAIAFSPDGKQVVTSTWLRVQSEEGSSVHGAVWIWEGETGAVLHKKLVGVKPLDSVVWSADGSTIVVGSWDGLVHVLDREANEMRQLKVPDEGIYTAVIAVAISPDGRFIAAGSKDRTARIWNAADGELRATCAGHGGFVNEVLFSNDGHRLLTASVDATIRTWDSSTGAALETLRGHTREIPAMECLPNRAQLVSAGRDGTLRLWNLDAAYGSRQSIHVQPSGTYTTTFSPNGNKIYCSMYNGHVIVLDALSAKIIADWEAHADASCNTLALNADGSRLLTCSWDKTAKLWDTNDHSLLTTIDAGKGIFGCDLSRDGRLAALLVGNDVQIWDLQSIQRLGSCVGHESDVRQAAFSPNGQVLASVAADKIVRIWKVDSCECIAALDEHETAAEAVSISPDGRLLASAGQGEVILWNLADHRLVRRYRIGDRAVNRLSFSPDGRRLAVGSDVITIIDPTTDEAVLRFQPQNDDIYFLSFSPDGRRLASCTTNGSVVINETVPLRERTEASTQ